MGIKTFEELLEKQKKEASGQRLEMLGRDLSGTKKLVETVLLPTLKTLDGIILEHEIVSQSGVRIYIDAMYPPLLAAFESDGFVAHGENLTRDKFSFERMRVRTITVGGFRYVPYSNDELDKRAEACRRTVYELLGRYGSVPGSKLSKLPVYEREILRFGMTLNDSFSLAQASECLLLSQRSTSQTLHRMVEKQLLIPTGTGGIRYHGYFLSGMAISYFQ